MIVGPVDTVGPALAGGLIAGAVIGAAQWLALRSVVPWFWIVATSVGMAAGLAVGAAVVDYGIDRGDLVIMGAITGAGVGGLQALVLARQGFSGAAWWAAANPPVLGACLARHLLRDHGERRRAVHEFRRQRHAALRARDRPSPGVAVPSHGVAVARELNLERAAGARLIALPIAFNPFFFLLGRLFDYPAILRRPVGEILSRFHAGGLG